MTKFSRLFLAAVLVQASAFASAYQFEVNLTPTTVKANGGGSATATTVTGRYYFSPVAASSAGPLQEAAYVGRASNAGLSYTSFTGGVKATTLNGKAYFDQNWDGELVYATTSPGSFDVYDASIGYATSSTFTGRFGVTGGQDLETDAYVSGKYLAPLSTSGTFINADARISFGDNNPYQLGLDYYPDQTLSFGVGLTGASGFDTITTLRARKFFNESFSLGGSFGSVKGFKTYTVDLNGRF